MHSMFLSLWPAIAEATYSSLTAVLASGGIFFAGYESWSRKRPSLAIPWWIGAGVILILCGLDYVSTQQWAEFGICLLAFCLEVALVIRMVLGSLNSRTSKRQTSG